MWIGLRKAADTTIAPHVGGGVQAVAVDAFQPPLQRVGVVGALHQVLAEIHGL
jgi:hypothetical protein